MCVCVCVCVCVWERERESVCGGEVKMAIDLLAWVPCPSAPARWDSRACSRAASRASARSVSLSHADLVRCLVKTRSSVLSPRSSVPSSRCSLFLSLTLSLFSATEWQRNSTRFHAAVSGHLAHGASSLCLPVTPVPVRWAAPEV